MLKNNQISISRIESKLSSPKKELSFFKYTKIIFQGAAISILTILSSYAIDLLISKLGNGESISWINPISRYVSIMFFVLYVLVGFLQLLIEAIGHLKNCWKRVFK